MSQSELDSFKKNLEMNQKLKKDNDHLEKQKTAKKNQKMRALLKGVIKR
jgi:hypothetical protein